MKKGEIWLGELPSADGHEQFGTHPALILKEIETSIAVIIPLTSNLHALRFPYTIKLKPSGRNGLNSTSVAMVFQIRAIDKKRLKKKIGDIEETILKEADKFLKDMLGLY